MVLLAGQAVQPAEDFAFRYENFDCGAQLIDTFKGTYRRTIAGANGVRGNDVSIPLVLTREQRTEIFRAIISSRFFDLPEVFNPRRVPIANVRLGNYMLQVRNAGREHTIWWTDRSLAPTSPPITAEERRRNELMRTTFRVLYAHPPVQRLPPPMGGCE
jgi:hypothetical protein